ncbi:hypothetical protein SDC9_09102 [bioreactor metagenome]|uniref:Uncharacterized protein n=1 Tax=bioreactor metagenome TaxID=1076179 RepID=A0A644T9H6_9ZZZZ|nr:hypothetical protein [Negativicutes bacterium]
MRQLTAGEMLSLNTLLQMESNALAVAKTSLMAIGDEDLKSMAQSGINAAETRVKGLQQFIAENHIVPGAGNQTETYNATGMEGGQQ